MVKIRTKKKLGQHFLNNEEISKKIESSHVNRKNLLEIGPGIGALTKYLIKETNTFLVIEIFYLDPLTILILQIIFFFALNKALKIQKN